MKSLLVILYVLAVVHVVNSSIAYATGEPLTVGLQWLPQTTHGFYWNTAAFVLAIVALTLIYVGYRKAGR